MTTGNDISKLPPEFRRAECFDGVFFLNLPDAEQRRAIRYLYLGQFELDAKQKLPQDDNWTGTEIRACCRLSALLTVPVVQAAQNVVPVAVTAAESVDRPRTCASGRCLNADQLGIYTHDGAQPSSRRKVTRSPLSN